MKEARVSVVIPCFRCAETISRAVQSVLSQTLRPQEILLVEDQSGDDGATLSALYGLLRNNPDSGIRIIELEKNGGPAAARNSGWEAASQAYIAFLDADDAWHPKKIEIQYSWMARHPEVVICGHLIAVIRPTSPLNRPLGEIAAKKPERLEWLLSCQFSTISVMLRRDLPFRFAPGKRHAEDYLLWLQIVLNGAHAWRIELPLAFCYKPLYGAGGLTKEFWPVEKGELDTYSTLHRSKLISFPAYIGLITYSFLKYTRRLALNALKKRMQL